MFGSFSLVSGIEVLNFEVGPTTLEASLLVRSYHIAWDLVLFIIVHMIQGFPNLENGFISSIYIYFDSLLFQFGETIIIYRSLHPLNHIQLAHFYKLSNSNHNVVKCIKIKRNELKVAFATEATWDLFVLLFLTPMCHTNTVEFGLSILPPSHRHRVSVHHLNGWQDWVMGGDCHPDRLRPVRNMRICDVQVYQGPRAWRGLLRN